MNILHLILVFVCLLVCEGRVIRVKRQEEEESYPPQPYEYSFLVNDPEEELLHRREEQGHSDGSKTGTIEYRDPFGRIVTETFVANEEGYFPTRRVSQPIDLPDFKKEDFPIALLKLPNVPEIDLTVPADTNF